MGLIHDALSGRGGSCKSIIITQNGKYNAADDGCDGYSEVDVAINTGLNAIVELPTLCFVQLSGDYRMEFKLGKINGSYDDDYHFTKYSHWYISSVYNQLGAWVVCYKKDIPMYAFNHTDIPDKITDYNEDGNIYRTITYSDFAAVSSGVDRYGSWIITLTSNITEKYSGQDPTVRANGANLSIGLDYFKAANRPIYTDLSQNEREKVYLDIYALVRN